jgi:hypothetical protein
MSLEEIDTTEENDGLALDETVCELVAERAA